MSRHKERKNTKFSICFISFGDGKYQKKKENEILIKRKTNKKKLTSNTEQKVCIYLRILFFMYVHKKLYICACIYVYVCVYEFDLALNERRPP